MAQIEVMSSVAIKAAYLELQPQFERASGHTVAAHWVPGVDLFKRIHDGAAACVPHVGDDKAG